MSARPSSWRIQATGTSPFSIHDRRVDVVEVTIGLGREAVETGGAGTGGEAPTFAEPQHQAPPHDVTRADANPTLGR